MPQCSYSAAQAKKSKTNFYYALRFLPSAKREAIFAVYAFCRSVDDAVDGADTPQAGERGVTMWRQEIDSLFQGRPAHPVMKDLATALEEFPIPKEYFEEVIAGVEMDLHRSRYDTFEDLLPYCHRVASAVGLISIEIFGYRDVRAKDFARDLGVALQLTNILRDVSGDADQNRIYLPLEDLRRFDVTEEDILRKQFTPQVRELLKSQYDRALTYYGRAAQTGCEIAEPRLFPAQIMGTIYRRILDQIAKEDFSVFGRRITIPAWQKVAIALRAWCVSRYFPSLLWRNAY
ncbi:MAG: presqualene diphosphate synthase HpnD [bacterium]